MGVKQSIYNLSDLAVEQGFRSDLKFLDFNIKQKQESEYYVFNELFDIIEKDNIEDLTILNYAEIGDVEKDGTVHPVSLNLEDAETDLLNADYYKKILKGDIIKPLQNSILLSSVRPNLKKFVYVDEEKSKIYFTKAFIQLNSKVINPLIMYYALRTIFFQNIISVARQGKGYPTLKTNDLKYLIFNKKRINKLLNNDLLTQIKAIDEKIKKLQNDIQPDIDIINKVFNREFELNGEKLNELKQEKYNNISYIDFSNNRDMRFSCKFHCKSAQFAMKELQSKTCKKIKHYIDIPIELGSSISPTDYDEDGEYYYLSMATVKNWKFEAENAQKVSNTYVKENIEKDIQKNDIIITRSGVAIGKVALIDDDIQAIFADFTMRIRLKNYNQLFAYYYFRSEFFQELIHTHKKGLQNKNIFPIQIQEFPMLDISLEEQARIVSEIKKEIDKQNETRTKITELRESIDKIIENAIKK